VNKVVLIIFFLGNILFAVTIAPAEITFDTSVRLYYPELHQALMSALTNSDFEIVENAGAVSVLNYQKVLSDKVFKNTDYILMMYAAPLGSSIQVQLNFVDVNARIIVHNVILKTTVRTFNSLTDKILKELKRFYTGKPDALLSAKTQSVVNISNMSSFTEHTVSNSLVLLKEKTSIVKKRIFTKKETYNPNLTISKTRFKNMNEEEKAAVYTALNTAVKSTGYKNSDRLFHALTPEGFSRYVLYGKEVDSSYLLLTACVKTQNDIILNVHIVEIDTMAEILTVVKKVPIRELNKHVPIVDSKENTLITKKIYGVTNEIGKQCAFLDFLVLDYHEPFGRKVSEVYRKELQFFKDIVLMPKDKMIGIFRANSFSSSGCNAHTCVQHAGTMLDVNYIIHGYLQKHKNALILTVSLYDINSHEKICTVSNQVWDNELYSKQTAKAVSALIKKYKKVIIQQ
jgi:hypothetical protein